MQETTFMLSGFSRGTWLTLENAKAKIENYFNKVYGKTVMVDDGSAVAVFYGNALIVPTGDEELKKIQINRLRLLDGFLSLRHILHCGNDLRQSAVFIQIQCKANLRRGPAGSVDLSLCKQILIIPRQCLR